MIGYIGFEHMRGKTYRQMDRQKETGENRPIWNHGCLAPPGPLHSQVQFDLVYCWWAANDPRSYKVGFKLKVFHFGPTLIQNKKPEYLILVSNRIKTVDFVY